MTRTQSSGGETSSGVSGGLLPGTRPPWPGATGGGRPGVTSGALPMVMMTSGDRPLVTLIIMGGSLTGGEVLRQTDTMALRQ